MGLPPLHRTVCVLVCLTAVAAFEATAQARMSERATLSQTVSGTVIALDYARPQIRGRTPFGERGQGVVYWGEVWTPGANWATTLELSADVTIAGKAVPRGKYSVWMAPGAAQWTVYLHPNPKLYHDQHPRPDSMVHSFPVTPVEVAPAEVLSFDFPRVTRTGTVLRMQWGTRSVELPIEVRNQVTRATMTAGQVAPYLGRWQLAFVMESGKPPEKTTIEIVHRDGHLLMIDAGFESELVPTKAPNEFLMGILDQGEIVDIDPEFPILFRVSGGRAVGFVSKSYDGSDFMTGTRVP